MSLPSAFSPRTAPLPASWPVWRPMAASAAPGQPVPRYPEALGPFPEATLDCLVDLGLSDAEIARYFHLSPLRVARLAAPFRERHAPPAPARARPPSAPSRGH